MTSFTIFSLSHIKKIIIDVKKGLQPAIVLNNDVYNPMSIGL